MSLTNALSHQGHLKSDGSNSAMGQVVVSDRTEYALHWPSGLVLQLHATWSFTSPWQAGCLKTAMSIHQACLQQIDACDLGSVQAQGWRLCLWSGRGVLGNIGNYQRSYDGALPCSPEPCGGIHRSHCLHDCLVMPTGSSTTAA